MIRIEAAKDGGLIEYARAETIRLLRKLTREKIVAGAGASDAKTIALSVDSSLAGQEIAIESNAARADLCGGSTGALLHAVYTFFQELGCVFEFSGELLPERKEALEFPAISLRHRPSFSERGIRMHLNFVQDQSHFSEEEFAGFIDNMARQRFNYLGFHMYTPQQWFPFAYRGVEHLDLHIGEKRQALPADMTGRGKVKVKEHWFPREFEAIRDPRELLEAMHGRFQRMMARAHQRGIRNCVSFEPEALPPALEKKLEEWTGQDATELLAAKDLNQEWQEGWSGAKLVEPDVRHPLIIDISVERCLQCLRSFPDMDELQLISREGTKWTPKGNESYETEVARLAKKFSLGDKELNKQDLETREPTEVGPEMLAQARPYWTVLPGENFYATVLGSLRFVEHALAVLHDPRVRQALAERKIATSIAVYSPHPKTIEFMMPGIARMLPRGTRFHCLADYGARDIAQNLPAWQPLIEQGQKAGVISWLEFDGLMALAQGWIDSLDENIKRAAAMGMESMTFNHWRVRSLEHNAAVSSAMTWDAGLALGKFKQSYFGRLFGVENVAQAEKAYRLLEEATLYAKSNTYNAGFAGDWVFRVSTNAPGYYWPRLARSRQNYEQAAEAFSTLAKASQKIGRKQAGYVRDICEISALHIKAIHHLQNAKLPLYGYKAWPLGNENAGAPPPAQLSALLHEAETALALEGRYMRRYAKWVTDCDEQGQLCSHEQGVIQPLKRLVQALTARLEAEKKHLDWLKQPLREPSRIQPV